MRYFRARRCRGVEPICAARMYQINQWAVLIGVDGTKKQLMDYFRRR